MNHFYALMPDDTVRLIPLKQGIVDEIKEKFNRAAKILKPEGIEEDKFSGDFLVRTGENIVYVDFNLPESFNNIPDNQADIQHFLIDRDKPKSLFWFDNGKFYFQIFNRRSVLDRKFILKKMNDNTFGKITDSLFIVEDKIQAIYENNKLYFQNYTNANQIFSLIDFVTEATNEDIDAFGNIESIVIDTAKVKEIGNVKTRRLIKSISQTNNIELFSEKGINAKKKLLNNYEINVTIDKHGKLIFPTNDAASLNRALEFFNEDIFTGEITKTLYRTNSKKKDK